MQPPPAFVMKTCRRFPVLWSLVVGMPAWFAFAAVPGVFAADSPSQPPDFADIAYGEHERQRMDIWLADGETPRPMVVMIHGGGFRGGDKSSWRKTPLINRLLSKGVSCAAINYRFRKHAPIQEILRDVARAVQTLRHRRVEFNLDAQRLVGWGGSAGAGSSLWLTTRDDLADPDSSDAVARESSRFMAAVLLATQATYDLTRWSEFLPEPNPDWFLSPTEVPEMYHFKTEADLVKPESQSILRECDMLRWISQDDGPVFIANPSPTGPPRNRGHYLHHPNHATAIMDRYAAVGVTCVNYRGPKQQGYTAAIQFVLQQLREPVQ